MPNLSYTATDFPTTYGPNLAGTHSISVSWAELLWAAISVGKAQLQDLALYGIFSAFEMIYRTAIIYMQIFKKHLPPTFADPRPTTGWILQKRELFPTLLALQWLNCWCPDYCLCLGLCIW